MIDGVAEMGSEELGVMPVRKPTVTIDAAIKILMEGRARVWMDDTTMVNGSTRPRAIWKKEASTPRRQRVFNTSPAMLTDTTGNSFLAVASSNLGISILGEIRAATWSRTTAISSWLSRYIRGRSGEEFKTALFL